VVRKAILKEISFVDSGADAATSARIAAMQNHSLSQESSSMSTPQNNASTVTATLDADPKQDEAGVAEGTQQPAVTPKPATPPTVNASASSPGNATPNTDATDPVIQMRQRIAAETRRIESIQKICDGKHPGVQAQAIEEGWDENQTELAILRASRPNVNGASGSGRANVRNTSPMVFEAVALMASGCTNTRLEAFYSEPILEAADKLRGVGIQEFCELASGQQLPRFRRDATGWLQAAFSTTSLPGILSNIANKMLLEGYTYIEDSWRKVAKIASVNDFKEHSRYRMTGSFTFQEVGPDGELKHGKLDEQKYGQKAQTHGIMFALTRQMIVNDDMGAFTDIPRQIGMGAGESIADAVWNLWLKNPVQSDGHAYFSTEHNNYLDGADTALTIDGLTSAEVQFGQQVKPNGRPLGIPASILLVPTALKVPAQLLMTSMQVNETTTANKPKPASNPHVGKFEVVSSSYLSNASFTGNSLKAWYLLADPNRLPSIEVAFLNGIDRPTVEKTDADFNTLGVQFRGYIDFGVREQDYRGSLKLKGEA
jgi:phage major head subunit gpT-like protein